jgi:hypothetical protein
MWYILILIFVGAGLIFGFNSCWFNPDGAKTMIFKPNDSIKGYTKVQLQERLRVISKTAVPGKLSMGAMCYEVAAPPKRAEYICPVCGEKTLYSSQYVSVILQHIPVGRSMAKQIKGIGFRLDESQFCKKCSPDVKEPQLCIITKLKDESTESKCCGVYSEDFDIISEFISGKFIHKTDYDSEEPMKDHIDRLKQLLNLK